MIAYCLAHFVSNVDDDCLRNPIFLFIYESYSCARSVRQRWNNFRLYNTYRSFSFWRWKTKLNNHGFYITWLLPNYISSVVSSNVENVTEQFAVCVVCLIESTRSRSWILLYSNVYLSSLYAPILLTLIAKEMCLFVAVTYYFEI